MAKRISGDYATHLKDDLRAEVEARQKEGRTFDVTDGALKEDLVAALDKDDAARTTTPPVNQPPPAPGAPNVALSQASNIPQITANAPNIPTAGDDQPPVSEYKGRYVNKNDGEEYALCVRPKDPRGKTHKLLNSAHFWEGTETEFRLNFEKQ